MSTEMKNALAGALTKATAKFVKQKNAAAREGREKLSRDRVHYLTSRDLREIEKEKIKDAAYEVMEEAYLMAAGTVGMANARQIMYAARPLVLAKIGKCWEKSSYFTQTLLPDYMHEHPEKTESWDVAYDARGHLTEPHVRAELGLGTLEVRGYLNSWSDSVDADIEIDIDETYPTRGPANRYGAALFIEKEGFGPLLERARIAERFDLAIFSSKGQPTTATRQLVESLSDAGVKILVAHDFDISGLTIAYILGHSNRRYRFEVEPDIIDIGLRLDDVKAMNLQSEPVWIRQSKHPCAKFEGDEFQEFGGDYDVTEEEQKFLVEKQIRASYDGSWAGKRVELNAMTSDQFVAWLESKLIENGIEKVVPDAETLAAAWRRAKLIAQAREAVETIKEEAALEKETHVPGDLDQQVREILAKEPELSWDKALLLCKDGSDED